MMKPEAERVGKYMIRPVLSLERLSRLRMLLETILPQNMSINDFEVEHGFAHIGRRKMLLNAHRIAGKTGET